MGQKAFYAKKEQEAILRNAAGSSEMYDRYVEFAERMWPGRQKWTKYYYQRWIQKRRAILNEYRGEQQEQIREETMYNRNKRIEDLEMGLARLDEMLESEAIDPHDCDTCGYTHDIISPSDLTKLLEQKRKLLEAIAKERGEWLKEEKDDTSKGDDRKATRTLALELLQRSKEKQEASEG